MRRSPAGRRAAIVVLMAAGLFAAGCEGGPHDQPEGPLTGAPGEVRLMTAAPGHFHAALVQKHALRQVDPRVHVYAPDGTELDRHLALIEGFNARAEDPTHWQEVVYRGDDWLERLLAERPGNVLVTAGDNALKMEIIRRAAAAGIHVLADKPMIILPGEFDTLRGTLERADAAGVVVADIMTERHEIASILQRELAHMPGVVGHLVGGTAEEPGITKESVHYLAKTVAGRPLVRPAWFLDASRQGEAITDVATHLVDLVLWQAFPDEGIDYRLEADGVAVESARSWDTELTPSMFTRITGEPAYPDFLGRNVDADSVLRVAANGEFTFRARGVYARVSVRWGFENPGGGDTHFSRIRGTRANLVIRQDSAQGFRPALYVEPPAGATVGQAADAKSAVDAALVRLADRWPGLAARETVHGLEVVIPDAYREGHEEHFARVTEGFLADLVRGKLAGWERTNLLTRYWLTTRAYALAHVGG